MDALSAQLAEGIRAVVAEAVETVTDASADRWDRVCAREGWPVSVTALHVGLGLRRQASWIARALRGEDPFAFDWDETHALNARVAALGAPSANAALREIRKGGARLAGLFAEMNEDDLGRLTVVSGARRLTVRDVVDQVVVPHARGHLASIRAASA